MKIVVNTVYGIFYPSAAALLAYCDKKNLTVYFDGHQGRPYSWVYIDPPGIEQRRTLSAFSIERDDPALVEVVEEMGAAASNTATSYLKVIEIPDGVDYVIQSDDGREWVAEKHRTWSPDYEDN